MQAESVKSAIAITDKYTRELMGAYNVHQLDTRMRKLTDA